ncbi:MAG TPA: hypothetical protein VE666_05360 [Mycobacterium sp.]|nr:hypothetical protein [Mycobacterium sp.]
MGQGEAVAMGYARYIGRVGGLAVALGVRVAVASTPGWRGLSTGEHKI